MDLVDKINALRKEQKISQLAIAEFIQMHPPHLSNVLNRKGRKFQTEHIPKLAKLFNVSIDYLHGNDNVATVKSIPLIGLASCGIPQEYDLNGYEPVPISNELYRDGMYAVRAEGDSMSPKINDGNLVYCVANEQIENGNIVHYMVNGESGIKKFKINEKGDIISLVPINSDYDIITISADDNTAFKMSKVVGAVDTDF